MYQDDVRTQQFLVTGSLLVDGHTPMVNHKLEIKVRNAFAGCAITCSRLGECRGVDAEPK